MHHIRSKNLRKNTTFSKNELILFVLVFAGIGAYIIFKSFAATPVTFGITTPGNTSDGLTSDQKQVAPYTASQPGQVSKITGYISGAGSATGTQQVKALIYADSSGSPGALLGVSNEVTVNGGQALGWVDFSFSAPISINAGTIWMGYIGGGPTNHLISINANVVSHNNLIFGPNTGGYAAGPSNPFGPNQSTNAYQYVLYATYTSASSGFSKGDLNSDGFISQADITILAVNINTTYAGADVNRDGIVNYLDLSIIMTHFGESTGPAPSVTISASPNTLVSGNATTISWSSTDATSCTASGAWSGAKATSGTFNTGALSSTSTYNLSCSGPGGNDSGSVTVIVSTRSNSIYWGAFLDGDNTYNFLYGGSWQDGPWDTNTVNKFKANAGKQPSVEKWGHAWDTSFDYVAGNFVIARGDIPSVDWSNDSYTACDADVAAGLYDSTNVIPFAKAIGDWGHPLLLTFDAEMNGSWYHFSPGQECLAKDGVTKKINTAADFVAMWRHVHDVYVAQGATNVSWVWCVNADDGTGYLNPMDNLYPGDAYVDWTGINGYNWGTHTGDIWRSFDTVYNYTYNKLLTIAPSKPILIGEIGSDEAGGSKAAWITDVLSTQLPLKYPQIKAMLWFNWRINEKNTIWNWEIESSPSSQASFAQGISNSYYAPGGTYGNLPLHTKVPVP